MADQRVSLDEAWSAQLRWSQIADAAHATIDRRRIGNLALLIAAAAAGALGGLIDHTVTQRVCAAVAAGLLALAAALQQLLSEEAISRWIDTRLASERLQGAVYRALVAGDGAGNADELRRSLDEVTEEAGDHLVAFEETVADDVPVPDIHDLDSYIAGRAREQAAWHRRKLGELRARGRMLRQIEFALTVLGVIASAIAAATEVSRLAAVVTLLTTAAAVVAAHIGATKYERVAAGYARTTNRIERAIHRLPDAPSEEQVAMFVDEVENVLAQQNESWAAINSPS